MGRSPCCDKNMVNRGPWSPEEDALLKNLAANFGNGGNWISLPKKAGLNRCGKSCRLRWLNYLRPDIKHGDFTDEEDLLIYKHYHTVGSRWSMIASKLPGRTDNDIKNYWNTKLRRKILAGKFKDVHLHSTPFVPVNFNKFDSQSSHAQTYYNNCNNFNQYIHGRFGLYQEINEENYVTPEISSQNSGSSSTSTIDENQSSSVDMMNSSSGQENEFWMDLFSESFDDGVVGTELVDEKISEIASLLDVFVE